MWKDVATLRDIAEAMARALVGFQAGQVSIAEFDGAGVGARESNDGFERGGFADAVAAHETDEAALRHSEVHAAQDTGTVVGDGDVGKGQHKAKLPIPSSRLQRNSNIQAPNTVLLCTHSDLNLGAWSFSGA